MSHIKKILAVTLSLFFLSTNPVVHHCFFATGLPSAEPDPSNEMIHSCHSQDNAPSCTNETNCQQNFSCCNVVFQNQESYSFILAYHSITPEGIFFYPFLITQSLYHPPRSLL